jgi:hypothetical protein
MGDPKRTAERIPQLIWAIIKSSRYFYSTVCTRDDLNPEDGDLPRLPSASLDAYTFLLKAELPIEVDGIPDQWLPAHKRPTTTHTTAAPKPASRNDNQSRQQPQNPFNPSSTTGGNTRTCPNQPAVFANNETLRDLKNRRGRVMKELIEKAGIPGGQNGLNLTALPENICLRYLLLGQCHSTPNNDCKRNHPTTEISKEGAETLFKQLEPGLKRMADKNKRQRTE